MTRKYFGTDGVRGQVGEDPITPEFALLLAQAAGRVLRRENPAGDVRVLIGKDTRVSGYMIESAMQAGFLSSGVDVVLAGPLPTPAIAYLTQTLRLDAGVVISASHNPFYDNGIKFFSNQGTKIPDETEDEIEKEIALGYSCVESAHLGKAVRLDDAAGRYIEFCKSTFPKDMTLRGMRIYVDSANGAAYHIASEVYHELGAYVVSDGNKPDGFNINAGLGATHTESLPKRVRESGCEIGIALDGDADRVIMADKSRIYDGDQLLYVIASDRLARKKKISGVVGTLMTNFVIEKKFKEIGLNFYRAKVGDRYVLQMMKEKDALMGGENSGHIIIADKQTTGDGVVSSLQALAVMRRTGKTLAELLSGIKMAPQVLVNRRFKPGYKWERDRKLQAAIKAVSEKIKDRGRVLVRASGTEPVIRVMVECESQVEAKKLAKELADLIPTA